MTKDKQKAALSRARKTRKLIDAFATRNTRNLIVQAKRGKQT